MSRTRVSVISADRAIADGISAKSLRRAAKWNDYRATPTKHRTRAAAERHAYQADQLRRVADAIERSDNRKAA